MNVGDRIKEIRIKLGMSQVDFADKINVSKQTLYKYENNIITNIPSDKVEAVSKIGNVSPAYLMGWNVEGDKAFISYLESLGYHFYQDDPEHLPFMGTDDFSCKLNYGTLDSLKSSIDKFTKATVDSELLALKEAEFKQERLEKERIVRHLQGENIYSGSQFERDRKSYLEANAASRRTDLSHEELNDEARNKHDDDIMDDPNF